MRLGESRIALRKRIVIGSDDYGADIVRDVDTLIRWCNVTPTRSAEDETRSAPALSGLTIQAPAGTGRAIESADVIIYPITAETRDADGRPVYVGRQWEVVGDVGDMLEYVETQVRRTS